MSDRYRNMRCKHQGASTVKASVSLVRGDQAEGLAITVTSMEFDDAVALYFGEAARAEYEWGRRYAAYIASAAWQHKRLQKLLSVVGIAAEAYHNIDWLAQNASQ